MQDVVPYDVDTSKTAPFVVQGDEGSPIYEKVATNPNNAYHQNLSELSLPSGWVMTIHEIEGSKLVILLTHKSIQNLEVFFLFLFMNNYTYVQQYTMKYMKIESVFSQFLWFY